MSDPFASDASRLQSALARWLADHDVADPAVGAVELAHIVRGHGWRPVAALRPVSGAGHDQPTTKPKERADVAEALARCAAAGERFRSVQPNPERTPE